MLLRSLRLRSGRNGLRERHRTETTRRGPASAPSRTVPIGLNGAPHRTQSTGFGVTAVPGGGSSGSSPPSPLSAARNGAEPPAGRLLVDCEAAAALLERDPVKKAERTLAAGAGWDGQSFGMGLEELEKLPERPGVPDKPELVPIPQSQRESGASLSVYILHTLCHIEFSAVNMYLDTLLLGRRESLRRAADPLPSAFYREALDVACDESRHFLAVSARLRELGAPYGTLQAHSALWSVAALTRGSLEARLAMVPMGAEARGLDAGPRLVKRLVSVGDLESARLVQHIVDEEEAHVAFGIRWFSFLCARTGGVEPSVRYQELVRELMPQSVVPPFNSAARLRAGMGPSWYEPVAVHVESLSAAVAARNAKATARPTAGAGASAAGGAAGGDASGGNSSGSNGHGTPPSRRFSTLSRVAAVARVSTPPAQLADQTVLFVTAIWPERRASAAGVRTWGLMEILAAAGMRVAAFSAARPSDRMAELRDSGVECVAAPASDPEAFERELSRLQPSVVVFDQFYVEEMYGRRVRALLPRAVRVLDTQDLHFLRELRQNVVESLPGSFSASEFPDVSLERLAVDADSSAVSRELASIARSDLVLMVSDVETSWLETQARVPPQKLLVAPFFIDPASLVRSVPHGDRAHFVSIGNFRHAPNVDSVRMLKDHVWPLIRHALPAARMDVYGAYPSREHQAWDDVAGRFRMRGPCANVTDTLMRYRVLLAPLRFGAGVKGKIAESWVAGTPVVTTAVGIEGMGPDRGRDASLCAPTVASFVNSAVRLYNDPQAWASAQRWGQDVVTRLFDREMIGSAFVGALAGLLSDGQLERSRKRDYTGNIVWRGTDEALAWKARHVSEKEAARHVPTANSDGQPPPVGETVR